MMVGTLSFAPLFCQPEYVLLPSQSCNQFADFLKIATIATGAEMPECQASPLLRVLIRFVATKRR
jgi:hypothetical protein